MTTTNDDVAFVNKKEATGKEDMLGAMSIDLLTIVNIGETKVKKTSLLLSLLFAAALVICPSGLPARAVRQDCLRFNS